MTNIAIISDSSIAFTEQELQHYEVYTVPNIIMHSEKTYFDQVTITNKEVNELLRSNADITTAQPNIGNMIETFEKVNAKGYDFIIIISLSSHLSGGYNAFCQAAKQAKLQNYVVIDSRSIAGPTQQAIKAIRSLSKQGKSVEEILAFVEHLYDNQVSYLYPKNLDAIVKSGRASKTTAKIVTMLKIKTLLYFKQNGESIEKLAVARTDKKIFDTIIKDMQENNVSPKTHDLYFLDSQALDAVVKMREYLFEKMGEFDYYMTDLPASISVHVGSEAIAVQWCLKIPE